MKDQPLHDFIIIQMDEEIEETKEGILLAHAEEPNIGVVISVGPGRETAHGHTIIPNVSVGDRVRVNRHALIEINKKERLHLIDFSNIYSTIK